jgi:hypothetical protein
MSGRAPTWVPLFEVGVRDTKARPGWQYQRPARCRICKRRFRRSNPNHGEAELRRHPEIVRCTIESSAQGGRYLYLVLR